MLGGDQYPDQQVHDGQDSADHGLCVPRMTAGGGEGLATRVVEGYCIDVADICGDVAVLWRDDDGLDGCRVLRDGLSLRGGVHTRRGRLVLDGDGWARVV